MLSAFFSGSEIAVFSISRLKVRHMLSKGKKNAVILKKFKDDPDTFLSTVLIGNNLVNVAASVLATSIAIDIFGSTEFGLTTGVMTFLLLVFGEITPKSIAVKNKEIISLKVAKPMWVLSIVFYPIIKVLKVLLKISGPVKKKPLITEEELISFVYAGKEEGTIKEEESRMIQKIFEFDNVEVGKVMTPRKSAVMIEANQKISDVLELTAKKKCSRLPVYEQDTGGVIGIAYIKDALGHLKSGKPDAPVKAIMRQPFLVHSAKKLDSVLRNLQKRKEQMALVVNDSNSVIGIVTIEDLLEEIVGELSDEKQE